jgi:hypothetical protein
MEVLYISSNVALRDLWRSNTTPQVYGSALTQQTYPLPNTVQPDPQYDLAGT